MSPPSPASAALAETSPSLTCATSITVSEPTLETIGWNCRRRTRPPRRSR